MPAITLKPAKFSIQARIRKVFSLIWTFLRWFVLPDMPSARTSSSALSVGRNADDIAILVVGGVGFGDDRYVEMLSYYPNSNSSWRWRKLAPLLENQLIRPGMLLLSGRRVLIVDDRTDKALMFRLPRDENDPGQWTYIANSAPAGQGFSFIVNFKGRTMAFGGCSVILSITSTSFLDEERHWAELQGSPQVRNYN